MASIDIDSIFLNILPYRREIINICTDNSYNGNDNHPKIPKHDFRNLFTKGTKESFVTFNNNINR